MPEAEQGMNVAKVAAFRAGLPITTAGMTINRYCASGLQSIALAADRIRGGGADVIVAGGTESMSCVPMGGNKISVNPWLVDNYPGSYMSMGLTAERVAAHYGITREAQDQFSYESHQKALRCHCRRQSFTDEIVPVEVATSVLGPEIQVVSTTKTFSQDEGPAPRHLHARSPCQTQAGLPCQGHGHRRQLVPNLRRSRRCGRHVGLASRRAGQFHRRWPASCAFCLRRLRPGRDGHRPDLRHP